MPEKLTEAKIKALTYEGKPAIVRDAKVTDVATTPGGLHTDTLVDGDFSSVRGIWPGK